MNTPKFDPKYVQISIHEAAEILGISFEKLERLRRTDENFPEGFKDPENWLEPIRFCLSDVYQYSAYRMSEAEPAPPVPASLP